MAKKSTAVSVSEAKRLDRVFGALSDTTRRLMLKRLMRSPAKVGELAAPFSISSPAVSRHVRVLESAGLLRREIRGREHWCHLEPAALDDAATWLTHYRAFWEDGLDALAAYVEDDDGEERDSECEGNDS